LKDKAPTVVEAFTTIFDDDERNGQKDLTVIGELRDQVKLTTSKPTTGAIQEDGEPTFSIEDTLSPGFFVPLDSPICIIPHCRTGSEWDFGFVSAPDPNPNDISYLVSCGPIIMTQSASLSILRLATRGKMTPQRLWKLVMSADFHHSRGLSGIDYGEIRDTMEQFPPTVPKLCTEELIDLEELGNLELIQKTIIHRGGCWVWMRPDR
jgi:hypothetical protein